VAAGAVVTTPHIQSCVIDASGGRPARERAGRLPYRISIMTMALIISSRIANIFSKRARDWCVISYLWVVPAGEFPPAFPYSPRFVNKRLTPPPARA
jgi:hypothetical protein